MHIGSHINKNVMLRIEIVRFYLNLRCPSKDESDVPEYDDYEHVYKINGRKVSSEEMLEFGYRALIEKGGRIHIRREEVEFLDKNQYNPRHEDLVEELIEDGVLVHHQGKLKTYLQAMKDGYRAPIARHNKQYVDESADLTSAVNRLTERLDKIEQVEVKSTQPEPKQAELTVREAPSPAAPPKASPPTVAAYEIVSTRKRMNCGKAPKENPVVVAWLKQNESELRKLGFDPDKYAWPIINAENEEAAIIKQLEASFGKTMAATREPTAEEFK